MDQGQSEDRLLDELASSTPLADPAVVALVQELTAEIGRLRAGSDTSPATPTVEALTGLLLGQAAELQDLRERLQRVRALIDLSSWAAGGAADPSIRASDLRHAIGGPIAERAE